MAWHHSISACTALYEGLEAACSPQLRMLTPRQYGIPAVCAHAVARYASFTQLVLNSFGRSLD